MPRFQIVNRPSAAPYCCLISRRADEDWYVDFTYSAEDGAVYLGKNAAEELCRAVGWMAPDEFAEIVEKLEELESELANYRSVFADLDGVMRKLPAILKAYKGVAQQSTTASGSNDPDADETP